MSNRTKWVWDHIEPADDAIGSVQGRLARSTNPSFVKAHKKIYRAFDKSEDVAGGVFHKIFGAIRQTHGKLPHPQSHWHQVKGLPTMGKRVRGGIKVMAVGGERLAGHLVYGVAMGVTGLVRGAEFLLVGVPCALVFMTVGAVQLAVVGGPWLGFGCIRAGMWSGGMAATGALKTPATVRRLAGAPPHWLHNLVKWVIHGQTQHPVPAVMPTPPDAHMRSVASPGERRIAGVSARGIAAPPGVANTARQRAGNDRGMDF